MKRPILVAVTGYIIGIIWGLYFKFSIALLYVTIFIITVFFKLIIKIFKSKNFNKKRNFNIFSLFRYFRYIKLFLNLKVIILIMIFSILSNTIVIFKNEKYNSLYCDVDTAQIIGIISSFEKEGEYKNSYKIKVIEINGSQKQKNTYLYLNINKKYKFKYGDIVQVKGEFIEPDVERNFGGFSYKNYLKTLNIYGTINASYAKLIKNRDTSKIEIIVNELKDKINKNAKVSLNEDIYPIYLGLVLGDTSQLDEKMKDQFRISNMSHILAVSGMHISYIIMGSSIILSRTLGKRKSKIVVIFILILYTLITGFSPSVVRASLMGIMVLLGSLLHRKNDIWNSIAISLFIILIYNPYLITSVSFQFSYAGTIGIILLNKNVLKILNKGKERKSKIKEIISICLSAQIFILPITIFHFNVLGIYFLLSNFLISFIIGPTIIICFLFLILFIFNIGIIKYIQIFLIIPIKFILFISNLSYLPMSKIYISTPNITQIILFYLVIIIINIIYSLKKKINPSASNLRVRYMLDTFKFKFREWKKNHPKNKYGIYLLIIILIFIWVNPFFKSDLKIHFVDVGQGDCCFIETPNRKTILIDGGGSEFGSFDVGKNTLIPYILDRGYTKLDYIFISHFDTDHVRTEY